MVIINKDGKKVVISGSSVQITDGKMFVDGTEFNIEEIGNVDSSNPNKYEIVIQGDIDKLEVTQCGSINIKGDVDGDVHTNCGSITCGNVDGDVHTNMGNINYRK